MLDREPGVGPRASLVTQCSWIDPDFQEQSLTICSYESALVFYNKKL